MRIINIGIVDADLIGKKNHRFPNLACMKISSHEKSLGNNVEIVTDYGKINAYDRVYISKVFTDTCVPEDVLHLPNVCYGGTGFFYDKATPLPDEIEHSMPDYHLYDIWVNEQIANGTKATQLKYYTDYSIGFLTRGCFRQCEFCVNKNYRKVSVHSPLKEFWDASRPKICLLDDNFFGCHEWKRMLAELKETNVPFQFKQGLDERLLTDERCEMLFSSKYDGDFIFAFDNVADYDLIEQKLKLIRVHTHKTPKFYVLCGFDRNDHWDESFWKQDLWDLWVRIELLMRYGCLPYIMRYNRYVESPYAGIYVTIARWCNQPSFFKKKSLREFVLADNTGKKTASASTRYLCKVEQELPELAQAYFDIKYTDKILRVPVSTTTAA